ncbi:hypothetical protein AB0E69_36645 [Kribbella sp. NPDC026611]|uniref:hypothetical protein n=1 Tax=Kribbella sp. NPDC026611 TaxID=3154911 RepID=UPI0033FCA3BD
MKDFNVTRADAVVRVPVEARFTYEQIRETVQAVCDSGPGTTFFETTETFGDSDREFPVLGQHSNDPKKNLFVSPGPGMDSVSFVPEAKYSSLMVVADEAAQYGHVVHNVEAYPSQRAAEAAGLSERLETAFRRRTDGESLFDRGLARFRDDQTAARSTQPRGGDGAADRIHGSGAAGQRSWER